MSRSAPFRTGPVLQAWFVTAALAGLLTGLATGWLGGPGWLGTLGYAVSYVFGGWFGLRAGMASLRRRSVDIDLLMILAATGALVIGALFEGAMLLFLFSLSNVLQRFAMDRSRRAIEALMRLRPDTARLRRGDELIEVPLEEVRLDDVFVVKPGESLPLDGVVVHGESAVDQASLTGESVPVHRGPGDEVFGGTLNEDGSLEVRVTRLAHDSALARMIRLVEDAQSEKAETQRLVDRWEQPYTWSVLTLTAAAIAVPQLAGAEPLAASFYRAMTLMVAASPCALVISTPAAVLSAIAAGARHGVLFKGGVHVEAAGALRAIAFDKTGTLTEGKTRLTEVRPLGAASTDELLATAAAVQGRSEHHLARATLAAAAERGLTPPAADAFHAFAGKGVSAEVAGRRVEMGNPILFAGRPGLDAALETVASLQRDGQTAVLVVRDGEEPLGVLGFADTLRPAAPAVLADLRRLGIGRIVMLTGDNAHVAERIAAQAGVDEVHADLLPERKVEIVRELRRELGSVAMVGDGVNDAPALAAASVGVAMGAVGTDVALETADLVLMADDLEALVYAVALSRKARRTLTFNLAFSLVMIVVMVLAILTVGLPLPLAVVGHEGSTVLVSLNGLRLLAFGRRSRRRKKAAGP
jgi:Zn2+/Cd2+-exporting ATPase